MKFNFSLSFLMLLSFLVNANDGAYFSDGCTIYPMEETSIQMKKEVLSLTRIDGKIKVNVFFEFYNPGKEKELLVGFVTPKAMGDVGESNHPFIENFVIYNNGKEIPYEIKVGDCDTCILVDTNKYDFEDYGSATFVYLFKMKFKSGLNIVNHYYDYFGSSGMDVEHDYGYVLTTGTRWVGGNIEDFELNIDLGKNVYFYVNDKFEAASTSVNWEIVGSGKVTEKKFLFGYEDSNSPSHRMIRIQSGFLQLKAKNFKPIEDLRFGEINSSCWDCNHASRYGAYEPRFVALERNIINTEDYDVSPLTLVDLKFMRNYYYAINGYQFTSKELLNEFLSYEWYIPNPTLKLEDIELTYWQKTFIEEIKMKENELNEKTKK